MRTSPPSLLPLFRSQMQIELLGLLLLQPDRSWTREELARTLSAPPSSVHRELNRAVRAGVVRRDEAARPHGFQAEPRSPIYESLRDLLEQTVGVPQHLEQALSGIAGVAAASIHGSWAAGTQSRGSDIDLIVLGDADPEAVRRAVRRVGRQLGREVDITIFGRSEFEDLLREGNPFVRRIVVGPRVDLIGDLDGVVT